MKVTVDDNCTGCGLCIETCPDIFYMGTRKSEAISGSIPAEFEDGAQKASDNCPVEAIIID